MKYTFIKLMISASLLLLFIHETTAQDGSAKATIKEDESSKIRFNGLGRAILSQTSIGGDVLNADTSTVESNTDGEFLLDLEINALPNKNTEVQSILRIRNEFGGFFGAGVSVEVRELWIRGVIADIFKYRVGDMDLVMSPYTLFNTDEDGTVNEPAVFRPQRQVIDYEQFYTDDNTRRLQGAKLDFGLDFAQGLDDLDANAFITRIRGTDFFTTPTRFISGGQVKLSTQTLDDSLGIKADVGLNIVSTFDDLQSGNANTGIRNHVYSVDFDVTLIDKPDMTIHLVGEVGSSYVATAQRTINDDGGRENVILSEEDDTFLDIGARLELKRQNLSFSASFIDVGPDFFSVAAQSKRIDYRADKSFYNRLGTDRGVRQPGLFDLTRDRSLYTFMVSENLMAYDPRYANTMPYGKATPNRRGITAAVEYGKAEDKINARLDAAFLKEIRGQGTFELKNFTLLRGSADFNIHKFNDWDNDYIITIGAQLESTNRGGEEIEQVDFNSLLLELGLEAEVFDNFSFLLGGKLLTAEGREYLPIISNFNEVQDFPGAYNADDLETLLGLGFKYDFREDIYLTIQYNSYRSELGRDNPNNYDLNQVFVLYNMKF